MKSSDLFRFLSKVRRPGVEPGTELNSSRCRHLKQSCTYRTLDAQLLAMRSIAVLVKLRTKELDISEANRIRVATFNK